MQVREGHDLYYEERTRQEYDFQDIRCNVHLILSAASRGLQNLPWRLHFAWLYIHVERKSRRAV